MRDLVPYLGVLACPLGMGLCMWLMNRGQRGTRSAAPPSLDELRDQHRRASAELEAAERRGHSA